MKQRKPIDFNQYNLKPPGAYRVDPNDFKDIMGTIEQADAAAKELLKETGTADGTKPLRRRKKRRKKPVWRSFWPSWTPCAGWIGSKPT